VRRFSADLFAFFLENRKKKSAEKRRTPKKAKQFFSQKTASNRNETVIYAN